MALTKCSECNNDVSTKAEQCPHCGAPIKKKKTGCGTILLGGFCLFIVISLIPTCISASRTSTPVSTSNTGSVASKVSIYNEAKQKFDSAIAEKYTELLKNKNSGDTEGTLRLIRQFENFKQQDYKDVKSIASEFRMTDALNRLKNTPPTDIKTLAGIYSELNALDPSKKEYLDQKNRYSEELKKQEAILAEQKKKEAIQRAAEEAEQAKVAARQKKIDSQFSAWDGSHRALERIIKESMNDPDSYKHVETKFGDKGDYILVETTFRGKNGFGGTVKNWVRAKFTIDGSLIEIVAQGP